MIGTPLFQSIATQCFQFITFESGRFVLNDEHWTNQFSANRNAFLGDGKKGWGVLIAVEWLQQQAPHWYYLYIGDY